MNSVVCLLALLPYQQVQLNPIASASNSTLNVNYVRVMTIKQWQSGQSPQKLAEQAASVIAKYGKQNRASVSLADGVATLSLGSGTILKVSKAEATANNSDLAALASLWAKNINSALELPILNFGQSRSTVPEGGNIELPFFGSAAMKSRIDVESDVVTAKAQDGILQITGNRVGTTKIQATFGDYKVNTTVTVLPVAAKFPQSVKVDVTGQPTDADTVAAAIRSAVRMQTQTVPGASIQAEDVTARSLETGKGMIYNVPVKIVAPGSFPVEGKIQVLVRNVSAGMIQEDLLWYSNVPENLLSDGQLYWGRLNQTLPVRVLAHHYNKTSRPIIVQYVLVNRDSEPARVATIVGDGDAGPDPAKVGYYAGRDFFNRWLQFSGEIIEIPPLSIIPLFQRRLSPLATMSGMASMRLEQGSSRDVVMLAYARYAEDLPSVFKPVNDKERPWQFMRPVPMNDFDLPISGEPKEVYRRPFRNIEFNYEVGGRFAFIRVGQEPISSVDGQQKLLGNFGVHYTIEGVLSNPTASTESIIIEFEASAGYSGAFFLVNNQFVDAKMMQSKQKVTLMTAKLAPGEQIPVRIQTMPLSGAHYPATITVRPDGHSNE